MARKTIPKEFVTLLETHSGSSYSQSPHLLSFKGTAKQFSFQTNGLHFLDAYFYNVDGRMMGLTAYSVS